MKENTVVVHLRAHDKRGHISGKGGATVAFIPHGEGTGRYTMDIVNCLESDSFCKAFGHEKAVERAELGAVSNARIDNAHDWNFRSFVEAAMAATPRSYLTAGDIRKQA